MPDQSVFKGTCKDDLTELCFKFCLEDSKVIRQFLETFKI